jgi:vancomycin resistance protein YoaR
MVENIGDISLDTGFAEALIIFNDRTVKGVGGGVCQVSTTLFRAAFFGGFPIVDRYPHAYRVYYYEMGYGGSNDVSMAGLDATVYAPIVDFSFVNDSDSWLLLETYVDPTQQWLIIGNLCRSNTTMASMEILFHLGWKICRLVNNWFAEYQTSFKSSL